MRTYYQSMPPLYNNGDDFLETLRTYLKFSLVVLFLFILVVVLLWHWQPWFKIEIKPIHLSPKAATAGTNGLAFNTALQSDVELIDYLVRPGDTLSEIAERYGVDLSVLLKHNKIDNPNILRYGQRLKIPRRGIGQLKTGD
jgi:hypothetical protein